MKKLLFILLMAVSLNSFSQNAFKRMSPPEKRYGISYGDASQPIISAWRFTDQTAGFMYPQNLVVTGLGFGYERSHWVDSTQRYYVNYSISGVVYAGGNVRPTLTPNNIISIGLSIGVLNNLINLSPCWNFPSAGNKGSFGMILNLGIPLN
jgi:hypothetical protein